MQALSIQGKDLSLHCKIAIWQTVQKLYMPCMGQDIQPLDEHNNAVPADDISLRLPSSLDSALQGGACAEGLIKKEKHL